LPFSNFVPSKLVSRRCVDGAEDRVDLKLVGGDFAELKPGIADWLTSPSSWFSRLLIAQAAGGGANDIIGAVGVVDAWLNGLLGLKIGAGDETAGFVGPLLSSPG